MSRKPSEMDGALSVSAIFLSLLVTVDRGVSGKVFLGKKNGAGEILLCDPPCQGAAQNRAPPFF